MQSQSQWYLGDPTTAQTNTAEHAYREALKVFGLDLGTHGQKKSLQHNQTLEQLKQNLNKAQLRYEQQHEGGKIGKWIRKFSAGICHYSRIFDVLVQHHPEYVSLAWGAMKFLFIVCDLALYF
jgi:hypothetical protein